MVGKNWGVRNRSEHEKKDTKEERELSTRGMRVIYLAVKVAFETWHSRSSGIPTNK